MPLDFVDVDVCENRKRQIPNRTHADKLTVVLRPVSDGQTVFDWNSVQSCSATNLCIRASTFFIFSLVGASANHETANVNFTSVVF